MTLKQRRLRRQSLRGWIKWVPVLLAAFGVLGAEAWLNVRLRANDYELGRIYSELEQVHSELAALRASESNLASVDRLSLEASDLGLQVPEPGQIQLVYLDARPEGITPPPVPYVLADAGHARPAKKMPPATPWQTAAVAVAAAPIVDLDASVSSLLADF